MTAAQAAPVRQPAPLFVVRLRMRTHAWTSPGMSQVDAETLVASLTKELAGMGGTYGFVTFGGRDGKVYEVRAREVAAVELAPEGQDHRPHPRPSAIGGPVVGGPPGQAIGGAVVGGVTVQVSGGPAPSGTAWLREQAAHQVRQHG